MNKKIYKIEVSSLPNMGTQTIPTSLTFDKFHRICMGISATITEKNGESKSLSELPENRKIFISISDSGNLSITTSNDETYTSAIISISYQEN